MKTPFLMHRSRRHVRVPVSILVLSAMAAGCQSPGFRTVFKDDKPEGKQVSHTSEAGLPEPTNANAANSSLSLTTVEEHLRLGDEELESGNFQQAQKHFDHVLKEHPDHVKAHHRLGVLADKLSQFEQAEQHYLTALKNDPRNASLLSDLGYSYFLQGRYADSEKYLLEARKLDPNYETAVANLGLLYGSTGRHEEAVAMFRQIGDETQIQAIMQQIASGQFGSPGAPPDSRIATQQSSVVTTQTTVQPGGTAAQPMNDATVDFVEQMRKAREDLRRAEEQYAQHRAQQTQGWANSPQHASPTAQPAAVAGHHPSTSGGISSQPAGQPWPPGANGQIPNDQLSAAMASIEASGQPAAPNQPIVIGSPESVVDHPAASADQQQGPVHTPVATAPGAMTSYGQSGSPYYAPPAGSHGGQPSAGFASAATDRNPVRWGDQQPVQPVRQPQTNQPVTPMPQPAPQVPPNAAVSASPPPSAWAHQFATAADHSVPPSYGAYQQTGATGPGSQQPVEHAYHTQQPGQRGEIALAGQEAAGNPSLIPPELGAQRPTPPLPTEVPVQNTSGHSSTPGTPATPPSYEQARRQAAMLGLSAGPGQVFPYVQQTQRVMPGADSRLNGAQYPSPVRRMPTGLTPPESYRAAHGTGGQPAAGPSMAAPHQPVQAPSTAHGGSRPPVDPYDQTRTQQSAQLNGLVNQTWGQSPQSPPHGVTPQSSLQHYGSATSGPPAGRPQPVPAQGMPQPGAPGTMPAGYHTPAGGAGPNAGAAYGTQGSVVPEPYSRETSGSQSPNVYQSAERGYGAPPVIVPGRR